MLKIFILIGAVCLALYVLIYFINRKKKKHHYTFIGDVSSKQPIQTYNLTVVNLDHDRRVKRLTHIVNSMRKAQVFSAEPYMGLSDKGILKDGIRTYELAGEQYQSVYLEKDDTNEFNPHAMKVLVKDAYGNIHKIGDVPARISKEIRYFMKKYNMDLTGRIIGGPYKDIIIDEHGKKEVKTFTSNYDVDIHLSFWNDEEI